MKSFSFAKVLTLGCLALLVPVACGDDDDSGPGPSGGSSGSAGEAAAGEPSQGDGGMGGAPASAVIPGTGMTSETIECGGDDCSSIKTQLPTLWIDPCCTTTPADTCGVSSGFLTLLGVDLKGLCLPKNQPGTVDAACPDSPASSVPFGGQMVSVVPFKGCCRPNNTCGFVVDDIETDLGGAFTSPELGCVDSAAFTGQPAPGCGDGVGGAGGSGGVGGMPSEGGASMVGGAGGAGGAP